MIPTLCMFDLSHNDPTPAKNYAADQALFTQALGGGYAFLMHKLTQGTSFLDPTVLGRLPYAAKAGLELGLYHYMDTTPVASQVAYFLAGVMKAKQVTNNAKFALALDFEYTMGNADAISTGAASSFCEAIYTATKMWPVLYTGRWDIYPAAEGCLGACGLWLAAYNDNPVPPKGWINYTWWQKYGDGMNGAPVVPGFSRLIDQSLFAGSKEEAAAWWAANSI